MRTAGSPAAPLKLSDTYRRRGAGVVIAGEVSGERFWILLQAPRPTTTAFESYQTAAIRARLTSSAEQGDLFPDPVRYPHKEREA